MLQLTWADLSLVDMAGWLKIIGADVKLANYEKLNALVKRVSSLPAIAEWFAKRPVTPW
jgi:glutathione S-transferase